MGGMALGWGVGLLLSLNSAGEVRAGSISVTFAGAFFQQQAPPFHLDESFSDARGSGRGIVDLPLGQLKGQIASSAQPGVGNFAVFLDLNDTFRVHFPSGGSAPITVSVTATGTGLFPAPDSLGDPVDGAVATALTINPRIDHDLLFTTSSSPDAIPVTANVVFPIQEVS
jgi:hypothetical protein